MLAVKAAVVQQQTEPKGNGNWLLWYSSKQNRTIELLQGIVAEGIFLAIG